MFWRRTAPTDHADEQHSEHLGLLLSALMAEAIPPVARGMALLYMIFGVGHWVLLVNPQRLTIIVLAMVTSALMLIISWLPRRKLSPLSINLISVLIVGLVLTNTITQMVLLRDVVHTLNVALLVVAIGSFILHTRWMLATLVAVITLWLLTLVTHPALIVSYQFIYLIFTATLLGLLIHAVRVAAVIRLDQQARELRQLSSALREQSIRDQLTGLYNRRYFDEVLASEMGRALRASRALSLLMIDLDYFKQVNDQLGHQAGDVLLQQVTRQIIDGVRASDVVCRFGGEELAVLLPETPLADATRRAEHLRQLVAALPPPTPDGRPPTCSIGVAALPQHGPSAEALIAAADSALYRAKQAGRNQVATAQTHSGAAQSAS